MYENVKNDELILTIVDKTFSTTVDTAVGREQSEVNSFTTIESA